MWGATTFRLAARKAVRISIRAPRVGSDLASWRSFRRCTYFNPRSPCGERPTRAAEARAPSHFNPRSPCGERQRSMQSSTSSSNFNPRSPCGERLDRSVVYDVALYISIRAPRVGSDPTRGRRGRSAINFNPRSPCGERQREDVHARAIAISIRAPRVGSDVAVSFLDAVPRRFQSALPVWGATRPDQLASASAFISIRAPRVGSDSERAYDELALGISIRAPRVGSDNTIMYAMYVIGISIRAPRVGSDTKEIQLQLESYYFNPRSPCGERHKIMLNSLAEYEFQSALPVWGATTRPT